MREIEINPNGGVVLCKGKRRTKLDLIEKNDSWTMFDKNRRVNNGRFMLNYVK